MIISPLPVLLDPETSASRPHSQRPPYAAPYPFDTHEPRFVFHDDVDILRSRRELHGISFLDASNILSQEASLARHDSPSSTPLPAESSGATRSRTECATRSYLKENNEPISSQHGEENAVNGNSLPATICPLYLTLVGSFDETDEEGTAGDSECEATSEEGGCCANTDAPHEVVERHRDHVTNHSPSPAHHPPVINARASADTTEPYTASTPETIQEVASNTTIRDATPQPDPSLVVTASGKSHDPTQEETGDNTSASGVAERPAKGKESRKSKKSKNKKTTDEPNNRPLLAPPDLSILEARQMPKLCGFSDCVSCHPTPANAGNEPLHPKGQPIWCAWCNKLFHDRFVHQLHLTKDPHRLAKSGIDLMEKNAEEKVKCRWPGCIMWISADSSSLKKHTTSIHTKAPMYHDVCGQWVCNKSVMSRHKERTCPALHGVRRAGRPSRRRAGDDEVEVVDSEDDTESSHEAGAASGEEENIPIADAPSKRVRDHKIKTKGRGRATIGRKTAATKKGHPAGNPKRARELKDDEDYVDDFEADDESIGLAPRRGGAKRRRC